MQVLNSNNEIYAINGVTDVEPIMKDDSKKFENEFVFIVKEIINLRAHTAISIFSFSYL